MKAIYNTLYNIIRRADFYYPMCDLGYMDARREFEADKNKYFKVVESQELTEEEKEDFKNLWEYKNSYCKAEMSNNKNDAKVFADKFKSIFNKYFATNK